MLLEKFSANPNCGASALLKINTQKQMFYFRVMMMMMMVVVGMEQMLHIVNC